MPPSVELAVPSDKIEVDQFGLSAKDYLNIPPQKIEIIEPLKRMSKIVSDAIRMVAGNATKREVDKHLVSIRKLLNEIETLTVTNFR